MRSLYNRILASSKELKTADSLVANSGLDSEVSRMLESMGYPGRSLSPRARSILFVALCDIIVVVHGDSYYYATFNSDLIMQLVRQGRVVPSGDKRDLSDSIKLIQANTVELINSYLTLGKFHFIKLTEVDSEFLIYRKFSLSTMNPYPELDALDHVYPMSKVVDWHRQIHNELIKGCYRLKMSNGTEELCQSYLSSIEITGGILVTHDLNGNLKELPVWNVVGYEAYSPDNFVMQLYRGVVNYDGHNITLNRDILCKYYSEVLVFSIA